MRTGVRAVVAVVAAVASAIALAGCGDGDRNSEPLPANSALPDLGGGIPPAVLGRPADGTEPAGVVILVRGGGWEGPLPDDVRAQEGAAAALRADGFATVSPDYRAGEAGLRDLLDRYDQVRETFPDRPICLFGQSAGGHLALVVAARRPDVACVVSHAGPTDLVALRRDAPRAPTSSWAEEAFGRDRLRALSPVAFADRIRARVLQITATGDEFVPVAQVRRLHRSLPDAQLIELPDGDVPFVHSTVDADAVAAAGAAQIDFLRRYGTPAG